LSISQPPDCFYIRRPLRAVVARDQLSEPAGLRQARAPPAMHYKQFGISSVASDLMLHRNLTGL
jgi:hypothetical protein